MSVGIKNSNSALGFIFHGAKGKKANELKGIPTIFWLGGGPGAVSLGGDFIQSGPLIVNVKEDNTYEFIKMEHSWTDKYNVIYVDQPIDVGVSVAANKLDIPTNMEEVVQQFTFAMNELFFTEQGCFYQFQLNTKDTSIFIYGESFAGKYIPAISEKILKDGNKFNLAGIGLFNPKVSSIANLEGIPQYALDQGLIDQAQFQKTIKVTEEGKRAVANNDWNLALQKEAEILQLSIPEGVMLTMIDGKLFYPNYNIDYPKLLNSAYGKNLYKLDRQVCNEGSGQVYQNLIFTGHSYDAIQSIDYLLLNDISVHVVAGDRDASIPYITNKLWINQLKWKHLNSFQQQETKVVRNINKDLLGTQQKYKNLVLDIVFEGGHNIISYAPEGSQYFVIKQITETLARKNTSHQ